MSLTVNDLPGILADLARLEPERFKRDPDEIPDMWIVLVTGMWCLVDLTAPHSLGTLQAAVQEAITAREWEGSVTFGRQAPRGDVWYGNCLEVYAYARADHPAIALAGAYRDAIQAAS